MEEKKKSKREKYKCSCGAETFYSKPTKLNFCLVCGKEANLN